MILVLFGCKITEIGLLGTYQKNDSFGTFQYYCIFNGAKSLPLHSKKYRWTNLALLINVIMIAAKPI